jgi:hypothetical protein
VFAFQVWIAERVLVTIFNRQGLEAWKSMINDANSAKLKDHFIICGYGLVGGRWSTNSPAWRFRLCSSRPTKDSAANS